MGQENFNLVVPLVKASMDQKGNWWVHGVASDETCDLQREVTLAGGLKGSLPYLRKYGKFNDDHKDVDVGEVVTAKIVTKGQLADAGIIEGNLSPTERKGEALYVAGPLYKHVDRAKYYRDVLRSGGRLGLSIQGAVLDREMHKSSNGQPVSVIKRAFVNKIAITGQPVNPNTWVSLKKSLAATSDRAGRVLMEAICKALTTGAGIVQAGEIGGSALRTQSLEGAKDKKRRRSRKEAEKMRHFQCLANVEKSFGGLSAEDVRSRIERGLRPATEQVSEIGNYGWVTALYDDHAVISKNGKFFSYPFTVVDGEVTLGEPTEVVQSWQPVAARKSLGTIELGDLDTPAKIAKAWCRVTNPEFVKGVDPDDVGRAMREIRDAAREHTLSKALEAEAADTSLMLTKSLTESDLGVLRSLESMEDADFDALVTADVDALKKSLGASGEAEEASGQGDPFQKSKGSTKGKDDEDEDDYDDEADDEDEEDDEDLEDDEEDEDEDDSASSGTRKSLMELLSEDDEVGEAFDIAPVLQTQAKIISKAMGELPGQTAEMITNGVVEGITKSFAPLVEQIDSLNKSVAALKGELEEIGKTPTRVGQYRVLEKSGGIAGEGGMSSREALKVLDLAAREEMISGALVTQYEINPASVQPALLKSLKEELVSAGKLK